MSDYEPDNATDPLEATLRAARADAFAPGFANRVMDRVGRAPVITLGRSMQRYFAWMTPALIAAILVLAVLNMRAVGESGVGAALGLPPVTITAAYSLDAAGSGDMP